MENEKKTLWQNIPKPVRAAFLACLAAGLLVHLFAFTNIIPNSDGLHRVYDEQQMTVSGRWFLHYATSLNAYIQAPMLIGALSVLFFSLSAALIADVLKIKSCLFAALAGIFTVVFPSVAYTYLYMFTASAYAFGILLAVTGVWLCTKYRFGFIPAFLCIACATGVYQAYFAVAAALALCRVITDLIEGENTVKDILKRAALYAGTLAAGGAAYYLILKVFLAVKHLKLLSYLGMNEVSLSLSSVLSGSVTAYKQFVLYFFKPGTESYVTSALTVFNALLAVALICGAVRLFICGKTKKTARVLLTIAGFALLPLACNLTAILSPSTPIMRYAFVFVYILAAAVLSFAFGKDSMRFLSPAALSGIICAFIVLISAQTANIAYISSATAHRATQAFATNLVGRVESLEGYENGMEVVIIGAFPSGVYSSDIEIFRRVEHYSCLSSSPMQLGKHVYYYLNDWLNVRWQEPDEDTFLTVSQSEAFRKMPLYPDDGSVAIEDGRVIVRLAENYTPKQQYELDYENRR